MKVALIHDHLAQDGGAEKVLKVLADIYCQAPIYTLLYEEKNALKYFADRRIETSIIQKLPGGVRFYQWYMPFMPMAVEFFDLREYDVVISDASAFAKGVITSPKTLHISYCHTPTRYLWDYTHQYINELKYNKLIKKIISLVLTYIRLWDRLAADRVDIFVANSETVRRRIEKYYRRPARVIYPPVDTDKFSLSKEIGDYFLIGGRLAPYKRVDIVVEAFRHLGWPLKIFGDGVDLKRLKKIANFSNNITFLGRVDEKTKIELYRHCRAFLNPQEEDFGITAVEAMAAGRPVIAFRAGGATETVKEGVSGLFFKQQSVENLIQALKEFVAKEKEFKPALIRAQAEKFSRQRFEKEIKEFVAAEYEKFRKNYGNWD